MLGILLAGCQAGGKAVADAPALKPVTAPEGAKITTVPGEPLSWRIPNIGEAAESYYAPDSEHLIAQVQSPLAVKSPRGMSGFLTKTFTDSGTDVVLINNKGWDACSYFFPDGKKLIWTSIKDNLQMPIGNWSDWRNYPQGSELYTSDRQGGNVCA